MSIQDSLDRQQTAYNLSGQSTSNHAKHAMQNLYRQQLDQLLQQKNRQKDQQKNRDLAEKNQYNRRAQNNKQSEKIKEQAYKNYYNMLLNNQEQLQSSYVSPFSVRDNMKDQHINHSVEQGEHRMKQWEVDERKKQMERKSMYRSQLLHQLQQRRHQQTTEKQRQLRIKQQFRKFGKLPTQIEQYERQKHLDQMNKYKQDLDKLKHQKDYFRSRAMSQHQNMRMNPGQSHHTLINPMPYNIQNPYLLREMNPQSYLASRGNQNFHEGSR